MTPDDGRDAPPSEDDARSERESNFSRRELLRAGSAVPVVLSAGWLAACGSHSDAHGDHTDAPHNDAAHTDTHTDGGRHSDHGHNDTGHNDTGHNDTGHNDTGHNDTGHNDTGHNDGATHGDRTIHDDAGGRHSDGGVEHTDVHHIDGGQEHTDTFHQDSTVHVDNP
jgi:hypothetical protein